MEYDSGGRIERFEGREEILDCPASADFNAKSWIFGFLALLWKVLEVNNFTNIVAIAVIPKTERIDLTLEAFEVFGEIIIDLFESL